MHDYRNNDQILIHVVDGLGNISSEILAPQDFILRNPYNINLDRVFMANTAPLTLDGFFTIAQQLIKDSQDKDEINEDARVQLIEEYPPQDMSDFGNEVITFRVIERKPGMMSKKGTERPHRKATYSHQEMRPEMPNKIINYQSTNGYK